LVAAVFEKYSLNKLLPEHISKDELKDLKKVFGKMEKVGLRV